MQMIEKEKKDFSGFSRFKTVPGSVPGVGKQKVIEWGQFS